MVAYDQSFLNANVKQLPTAIYTVKMASAEMYLCPLIYSFLKRMLKLNKLTSHFEPKCYKNKINSKINKIKSLAMPMNFHA